MKPRLDHLMVLRGLAESRSQAQALIMSGDVLVNDRPVTKAGMSVAPEAVIRWRGKAHPWVSRGGQKLAHAITAFAPALSGACCVDIGASTGGFTDVLLHHGAGRVYAVDVGRGQLEGRLRQDARVVVLEQTNARYLSAEHIPEPWDGLVCDASFISLRKLLPAALDLSAPASWLCVLIKPQFEAGREHVGRGGVVHDPEVHRQVCADVRAWIAAQPGWQVQAIVPSPITGPKGNIEFLLYATRGGTRGASEGGARLAWARNGLTTTRR